MKEKDIRIITRYAERVDVIVSYYNKQPVYTVVQFNLSFDALEKLGQPERLICGPAGDRVYLFPHASGYKLIKNGRRKYFRVHADRFDEDMREHTGEYELKLDEECGLFYIEWRGEEE